VLALVGFLLLTTSVDPAWSPPNEDFGFYGSISLGAGFGFGRFTYSGQERALTPRSLTFESGLSGAFIALSGTVGHRIWRGLGVGMELEGDLYPDLTTHPVLPWTGVSTIAVGYAGPAVDWWPSQLPGLHFSTGLGIAIANFAASQFEIGAPDNIVDIGELQGMLGARAHVSAGYVLGTTSFRYGGSTWLGSTSEVSTRAPTFWPRPCRSR
jgi:hypothetical protein